MLGAGRDDAAEVLAQIDDQPVAQGSPAGIRPSAPGVHGDPILHRVPRDQDDIVLAPRNHDAQGIDLIHAGIVGVGGTIQGLKIELPVDDSPEVVINPSPPLVHSGDRTSTLIVSEKRHLHSIGRPLSGVRQPAMNREVVPARQARLPRHGFVRHASRSSVAQSANAPRSRNSWARIRSWRYRSPIARSKGGNRPSTLEPKPRTWQKHR